MERERKYDRQMEKEKENMRQMEKEEKIRDRWN